MQACYDWVRSSKEDDQRSEPCKLLISAQMIYLPFIRLRHYWLKVLRPIRQKRGRTWNLQWRKCENHLKKVALAGLRLMRMVPCMVGSVVSVSMMVMYGNCIHWSCVSASKGKGSGV